MRKALVLTLGLCLVAMFVGSAVARDVISKGASRPFKSWSQEEFPGISGVEQIDPGLRGLYSAAQPDTYCIVWYDFEQMNWQNFNVLDASAQVDTFFHVEDYVGISPGDFNGFIPLEGDQSMWCGTDGADTTLWLYFCSWWALPGYGNNWYQFLISDPLPVTGTVNVSYKARNDTEAGWDYSYVEYDKGNLNWQELARYDGRLDTIGVHSFPVATAKTKIRFRFVADGAASDQDGYSNGDGALHVDSIVVADEAGLVDYEDFELPEVADNDREADGDGNALFWRADVAEAFGSYGGLSNNLMEKDPCGDNFATQVVFFIGSTVASSSYPGLFDTPFCKGPGSIEAPCQSDLLVSPYIEFTKYSSNEDELQDMDIPGADLSQLGGAIMRFTVYRDIPLSNLVFYVWQVRDVVNECPGTWLDRNFVYYGGDMDFIFQGEDISDLLGADTVQMAIGCVDMCDAWYDVYGNCAEHTPSPYLDNVRLYRYKTSGPQWNVRRLDLFQDNFPIEEFDLDSYVRADCADDKAPGDSPTLYPGDSIVVRCKAPLAGGLGEDVNGPLIFLHVYPHSIADTSLHKPAKIVGSILEGDWGWYYSDDGTWTVIQGDTTRDDQGGAVGIAQGWYCFDLNDTLFTRGYMIEYYFTAEDADANVSRIPGPTLFEPVQHNYEFTCLPTGKSDILFVDDMDGRGGFKGLTQYYFDSAFNAVIPVIAQGDSLPDRYDINSPSSMVSNSPATRSYPYHLVQAYRKIIWDCGNLSIGTIGDGVDSRSDKGNDCKLLVDWMLQSENNVGVFVAGDDVAEDIAQYVGPDGPNFMTANCGVNGLVLNGESYYDLTGGRVAGGVITPLIRGTSQGIFYHSGLPDTAYAFGGCFIINSFDVLEKTSPAKYALEYPDFGGNKYYAGIQNEQTLAGERKVRSMWWGFSFMYLRDVEISSPIIRNHMLDDIITWFDNITNADITPAEVPKAYKLAQNFPNPFNPSTMIKFDVRERGNVTLKIYNVAGQLVKTLVNGVKDAGSYSVTWDGTNNRGSQVASGVFFYKMEAKNFSMTRKMVLLR